MILIGSCECFFSESYICKKHRQRQYYSSRYHGGLRYMVLKRDGYKCVCCDSQHYLNVHHVDGNRLNNEDPSNQVSLCARCHGRIERSVVFMCRPEESDKKEAETLVDSSSARSLATGFRNLTRVYQGRETLSRFSFACSTRAQACRAVRET